MDKVNPYESPRTQSSGEEEADVLYEIASRASGGTPYPPEAFVFLVQGIDFSKRHIQHDRARPESIDAVDLSWCLHDFAMYRFGENARLQLEAWNIRATSDFGKLVFRMVEVGQMQTEEGDSISDFTNVFDFSEEFRIQDFRPTILFDDDA